MGIDAVCIAHLNYDKKMTPSKIMNLNKLDSQEKIEKKLGSGEESEVVGFFVFSLIQMVGYFMLG